MNLYTAQKMKFSNEDFFSTHFFYKQHFYKERQAEIGKKSSKY